MAFQKNAAKNNCGCNNSVERMASALTQSMIRKEFLNPPKQFKKGENAEEYVRAIETYAKSIEAKEEDKVYLFLNNLGEDIKYQIFALPEYSNKCASFNWIKEKFIDLNVDNVSCPLLQLLRVKQKNMSIKEYVGQLRIKAYKLMGQDDPGNREKYLLSAFYSGLNDKNLALWIKNCKPKTLEEACRLIKEEAPRLSESIFTKSGDVDCVECVNAVGNFQNFKQNSEISELRKEVASLKEQIKYLISLSNNQLRNARATPLDLKTPAKAQEHRNQQPPVKCYNCNENGHISKYCKYKCAICGDGYHTSYTCPKRNTNVRPYDRKVRLISDYEYSDSESAVVNTENVENQSELEAVNCIDAVPNDNLTEFKTVTYRRNRKRILRPNPNETLINEWQDFIDGRRPRPQRPLAKKVGDTVITKRRPEKAANKPIVHFSCENVKVKGLLDSGAECNVIAEELLYKILQHNEHIHVQMKSGQLKCANGDIMFSKGIAWLNITLGNVTSRHPFKIVPGIFPELICGIRMMKKCGIEIKPSEDCIKVGNLKLPFISRVESEPSEGSVNFETSLLRVENRC